MNDHASLAIRALESMRAPIFGDWPERVPKIDAAIAWVKQVEADAGRYRWLVENIDPCELGLDYPTDYWTVGDDVYTNQINDSIDAAMKGDQDANKR